MENRTPQSHENIHYQEAFTRIIKIVNELREQCPWDMKQTMESLRTLTIEETYELADAIMDKDTENIKKELGDLFLHIIFYSRIAAENHDFDIADVIHQLCEKLISRHPHVYGDIIAGSEEEVKKNWELLKLSEKGGNKTVLGGIPRGLPALTKALRVQEKARGVGFDWDNPDDVWKKVLEELNELKVECEHGNASENPKVEKEFGDVLFALINYGRFVGVNPENALEKTNQKFISRFNFLEAESKKDGKASTFELEKNKVISL